MLSATRLVPIILLLSTSWVSSAPAGVLDWLFPLRAERQARRAAMRVGTDPPIQYAYGGTNAGGSFFGSGNYYPGFGAWSQPTLPITTTAANQTTAFRTIWAPVPVTTFRPTDGGSCLQPCSSFEWQAQRVPTLVDNGLFGSSGCTTCGFAPAPAAMNTGWTTPIGGVAATSCATCPSSSVNATAFGSTSPTGFASTFSSSTATDWMPVNGRSDSSACSNCESPVASSYSSSNGNGGSGTTEWRRVDPQENSLQPIPADTAPQLPADGNDTRSGSDQTYVPARSTAPRREERRELGLVSVPPTSRTPGNSEGQYAGFTTDPEPSRRPLPSVNNVRDFELSRSHRDGTGSMLDAESPQRSGFSRDDYRIEREWDAGIQSERQRAASPMQLLRPIPDPDRDAPMKLQSAPELLGPRDRTAVRSASANWQTIPVRAATADSSLQPGLDRQVSPPVGRRPQLRSAGAPMTVSSRGQQPVGSPEEDRRPVEGWRSIRGQ